jgi:hypothetical protein
MRYTWLCIVLAGFAGSASAADIVVTKLWTRLVTTDDLAAGTGSDLVPAVVSPDGTLTVTITNTTGSWRVDVERTDDANWPEGVEVDIRRSSSDPNVNGGASFITLTRGTQEFFSGTGDHANIEVQLRVRGASVNTRAGAYNLAVAYHIVAL